MIRLAATQRSLPRWTAAKVPDADRQTPAGERVSPAEQTYRQRIQFPAKPSNAACPAGASPQRGWRTTERDPVFSGLLWKRVAIVQ